MKFIIGIGNPGKEYENTRHNVGFLVLDVLKKLHPLPAGVRLVRPRTYVNRTGEAVLDIVRKFKAEPQSLLLVCDDVHLALGRMRLRLAGSSGGHKGLQSVSEALGTERFPRLRIGIKAGELPEDFARFVLEPFHQEEARRLKRCLEEAAKVCWEWAEHGPQRAMDVLSHSQTGEERSNEKL
ncbi:MAG: aminoacyl-tRNA hydrolase [Candidatus Omnitrophica bacterium]|nr:aminoacyl-tRNA hydrolase [Candidatus Omnitrophota bacterium]